MQLHRLSAIFSLAWPPAPIQSLHRLALATDPADAEAAWQHWASTDRLDGVSWQEQRLLARIHGLILEIDPNYIHRSRLIGMARAAWSTSELKRHQTLGAIALLNTHEIPAMLFKGQATKPALQRTGPRISGDLDIMVPAEEFQHALSRLLADGWTYRDGRTHHISPLPKEVSQLHGINLHGPSGGNLDLHQRPFHQPVSADYLSGLWRRSHAHTWMGHSVQICSPEDRFAILMSREQRGTQGDMNSLWITDCLDHLATHPAMSMTEVVAHVEDAGHLLEYGCALYYAGAHLQHPELRAQWHAMARRHTQPTEIARYLLNTPPAFQRGHPWWMVAGTIRRTSRMMRTLRN